MYKNYKTIKLDWNNFFLLRNDVMYSITFLKEIAECKDQKNLNLKYVLTYI